MTKQLFGTDGFRGHDDLTGMPGRVNSETFERLAFAYVSLVAERATIKPTFVVGGDTRSSTPSLLGAVAKGAAAAGAEVWNVGVAPTPMLAWLAKKHGINAIAITASHNPDGDNGFKLFEIGGIKPTQDALREVEERYWKEDTLDRLLRQSAGRVFTRPELVDSYLDGLVAKFDDPDVLRDKAVVVDGANGAASALAPALYRRLGAEVVTFACNPRAVINKDCGAAHLEGVRAFLQEHPELTGNPRFLGVFANDGDADRVMGVDGSGRIVNGNYWMQYLAEGQKGIVGTVYTNSALREAVEAEGVAFHECDNGDSYVTAKLLELDLTHGGEFTGHMIDLDHIPSGDGLYMGGWLAAELAVKQSTLSDVYDSLPLWPERLINVQVAGADGKAIARSDEIQIAVAEELDRYKGAARVILRSSGTEPLVRVWAEAKRKDIVKAVVSRLAETVRSLATAAEYRLGAESC